MSKVKVKQTNFIRLIDGQLFSRYMQFSYPKKRKTAFMVRSPLHIFIPNYVKERKMVHCIHRSVDLVTRKY